MILGETALTADEHRRTALFQQNWVHEAAMHYLSDRVRVLPPFRTRFAGFRRNARARSHLVCAARDGGLAPQWAERTDALLRAANVGSAGSA